MVIGITGILGSGKSTVCKMLAGLGAEWIHTDEIVHELYEEGNAGFKKIKEFFGEEFLNKGGVNRKKLRREVLKHPQKLWILNRLIHPLVTVEVNKKIVQQQGKEQFFCLEAVYFEENDLGRVIDKLVMIEADSSVIVERLNDRDLSRQEIEKFHRMKPRLGREVDFVIENNGNLEELSKEVDKLWQKMA